MLVTAGLIAIIVLFLLSAFWSGSEIALSSLSKYRIKKLIALNKPISNALTHWLKAPYYLLTTILVGNNITNILLGFLSTIIAIKVFEQYNRSIVELFTWLAVTFILVIFAELTPKMFCRAHPEGVTLFSLPILSFIERLSRPLVYPIIKLFKLIFLKKEPAYHAGKLAYLSVEEVNVLIEEAEDKGVLGNETSKMLERVLRLGDLDIAKIMTPFEKIESVKLDIDDEKFLDLVVETGCSRVPVYTVSKEKVVGFVYTKDVLWALRNNNAKFPKELVRPAYFVKQDKQVCALLKEFQSGQTHIAFVQDSLDNLVGIVTLEDILEEIVGEILDEYNLEEKK
ncbi:hemolysin family protein [Elusimicrobiota bacterium]